MFLSGTQGHEVQEDVLVRVINTGHEVREDVLVSVINTGHEVREDFFASVINTGHEEDEPVGKPTQDMRYRRMFLTGTQTQDIRSIMQGDCVSDQEKQNLLKRVACKFWCFVRRETLYFGTSHYDEILVPTKSCTW